jgi:hypothetical protein
MDELARASEPEPRGHSKEQIGRPETSMALGPQITGAGMDRIHSVLASQRDASVSGTSPLVPLTESAVRVVAARTRSLGRSIERSRERSPEPSSPLELVRLEAAGEGA